MSEYENQLIRESTGDRLLHDGYEPGDTNCEDCGQLICACESLSDFVRETVNPDSDVSVPAESGVHESLSGESSDACSGSTTGGSHAPHAHYLPLPESFDDWLKQNEDSIIQ